MTTADLTGVTASARRREWRPGYPVDVAATWGTLRRGTGDPAWHSDARALWRGIRTAEGPLTLRVAVHHADARVVAHAWGAADAVESVLDQVPRMLGADDDAGEFVPGHSRLEHALRRRPGWRVPCTGLVLESLIPAVIEQKVTGQEAFGGWRRLVRRHGIPAPGPGATLGLRVPPAVATLRALPSWEWLRLGISPQRSDTLMRVLAVAARLEESPRLEASAARRRLQSVRGVGVWSAAETAQRALGDADAVSFGDYHVAKNIGWALTGQQVDDDGLAELLAPWVGHRYRVQRLLELSGAFRPRHGPRMAPRCHLPLR